MKPTEESPETNSNMSEPSSIKQLMIEYHRSHQNHRNQVIHYWCVPLIFWSITAMLWMVPLPVVGNLTLLLLALLMLYYVVKSLKIMLVMGFFSGVCIAVNMLFVAQGWPLLITAIVVFVLAWVGQFVGHHIEGKRPSFFKDLQFLLIGPAWVMSKLFGIRV